MLGTLLIKRALGLADELGARLTLGNESTGPSPKRFKLNVSAPTGSRSSSHRNSRSAYLPVGLEEQAARREKERKSLDCVFEGQKWEEWEVERRAAELSGYRGFGRWRGRRLSHLEIGAGGE